MIDMENLKTGDKVMDRKGTVYTYKGLYKDIVGYSSPGLPPYAVQKDDKNSVNIRWRDGRVAEGINTEFDIIGFA